MLACNPWVERMPILTNNGFSYPGHLKTCRALLSTLPTNKPTNPPAHTHIHQAMNPPIHQSTNPCTHPCSQPHPVHQPTHLNTTQHPRRPAPHHLRLSCLPSCGKQSKNPSKNPWFNLTSLCMQPWVERLLMLAHQYQLCGTSQNCWASPSVQPVHLSTNPPTSAPTHPPSHQPNNTPIQQPIHPSTEPATPCPPTRPPTNQSASSSLCFAPLQAPVVLYRVQSNRIIHQATQGSTLNA